MAFTIASLGMANKLQVVPSPAPSSSTSNVEGKTPVAAAGLATEPSPAGVSKATAELLQECIKYLKENVKQELGRMVQAAVKEAVPVGEGTVRDAVARAVEAPDQTATTPLQPAGAAPQLQEVDWAQLQSTLQSIGSNMERQAEDWARLHSTLQRVGNNIERQAVEWVRLQSTVQRIDNNMERVVVSPVNLTQKFSNNLELLWPRHNCQPAPAVVSGYQRPDNI